jgi:hypothetical protein
MEKKKDKLNVAFCYNVRLILPGVDNEKVEKYLEFDNP